MTAQLNNKERCNQKIPTSRPFSMGRPTSRMPYMRLFRREFYMLQKFNNNKPGSSKIVWEYGNDKTT